MLLFTCTYKTHVFIKTPHRSKLDQEGFHACVIMVKRKVMYEMWNTRSNAHTKSCQCFPCRVMGIPYKTKFFLCHFCCVSTLFPVGITFQLERAKIVFSLGDSESTREGFLFILRDIFMCPLKIICGFPNI